LNQGGVAGHSSSFAPRLDKRQGFSLQKTKKTYGKSYNEEVGLFKVLNGVSQKLKKLKTFHGNCQ